MKRTNIYLDEEQTASLDKLAAQEGVSRAELIRLLLNRALTTAGDDLASDLQAINDSFGSFATWIRRCVAPVVVNSTLPRCGAPPHDPCRLRCADRAFAGCRCCSRLACQRPQGRTAGDQRGVHRRTHRRNADRRTARGVAPACIVSGTASNRGNRTPRRRHDAPISSQPQPDWTWRLSDSCYRRRPGPAIGNPQRVAFPHVRAAETTICGAGAPTAGMTPTTPRCGPHSCIVSPLSDGGPRPRAARH